MTPLQLEILLHYYASLGDYREGDFSAPAVRKAIDDFKGPLGLLRPAKENTSRGSCYVITERGRTFLNHVLELPLPVQTWVMP